MCSDILISPDGSIISRAYQCDFDTGYHTPRLPMCSDILISPRGSLG